MHHESRRGQATRKRPTDRDPPTRHLAFEFGATSADFDGDGDVDGRDFLAWQRGYSLVATATHGQGDADNDKDVDGTDLGVWEHQLGTAASLSALSAVSSQPSAFPAKALQESPAAPTAASLSSWFEREPEEDAEQEAAALSSLAVDLALEPMVSPAPRPLATFGSRLVEPRRPFTRGGTHDIETHSARLDTLDAALFELFAKEER